MGSCKNLTFTRPDEIKNMALIEFLTNLEGCLFSAVLFANSYDGDNNNNKPQ